MGTDRKKAGKAGKKKAENAGPGRKAGKTSIELSMGTRDKLRLIRDAYKLATYNDAILKLIDLSGDSIKRKMSSTLEA